VYNGWDKMLHIALSATIVYNGIVGYNHQQWDLRESTMRPGNPVFCNMNKWARSHEQKNGTIGYWLVVSIPLKNMKVNIGGSNHISQLDGKDYPIYYGK